MADADLFTTLLERYQKAQKSGPLTDFMSIFGGPETQSDVLREAQRTLPLMKLQQEGRAQRVLELKEEAETRKAQTEQQKQTLEIYKALHGQIKDFHALPEDVQNAQRPARIKEFRLFGKVLGNAYDDTDAEAFFTTPGYADKLMATTDPLLSDDKRKALRAELGAATKPEERERILDRYSKATDTEAMDFVQRALQLIPARFAGKENIPAQEIRALAQKEFPALSKSPAVRRAFEAALADDKLMAQYKVQTGAAAVAGQTAKATEMAKVEPDLVKLQLEQKKAETEAVESIKSKYAQKLQTPTLTNQIRDDYLKLPSVRAFDQATGVFRQMTALTGMNTPAADWGLLVSYAKITDPDSVAREGEQAAVKKLAAVDDTVKNAYERFIKRELFTPQVRQEIHSAARKLVQGRYEGVKERETMFRDIAKRQGVRAEDAVPDLATALKEPLPPQPPADPVKALKDELRGKGKK